MDRQRACWAEYFEQLMMRDPLNDQLRTSGLQFVDDDTPIDRTLPSLDEV